MTITTAPATTEPPEYLVAVTTPPPIECPSWCTVSYEDHAGDLANWEGRVIHWSKSFEEAGCDFRLARSTYVDGTPTLDEPYLNVHIGKVADCLTGEGAGAFAAVLLSAIRGAGS
jgi:hypothetical protein